MSKTVTTYFPSLSAIRQAAKKLQGIALETPLMPNLGLSKTFDAQVSLKREDLQVVRSYKIRGAYNKISSYSREELKQGVVCASAGNHAQGVAFSCKKLGIRGTIFMPAPTPKQKVEQVAMFGEEYIDIILEGDTFDDAFFAAQAFKIKKGALFIHPFDDPKVIEGQGTIALEILKQSDQAIDYLFMPIGGGGLAAGLSTVFKILSPNTKLIGVEPSGAAAMKKSFENNRNTELEQIDKFVDGAAVKKVGELNFAICKAHLDQVITVDEGKICELILQLYNKDAIVAEPAGALAVAVLEQYQHQLKGKNVVCILSGSNNDITRTEEIKERALLYKGLKHYFIVQFPQRAGALKQFVGEVLGPNDDITHFEYTKKNSRETGSAVVGIELKNAKDFDTLISKMKQFGFFGDYLNDKQYLLDLVV